MSGRAFLVLRKTGALGGESALLIGRAVSSLTFSRMMFSFSECRKPVRFACRKGEVCFCRQQGKL